MADNFTANPGAGGDTFAADDVAGIKYPRTKISWGVDGAAVDVSAADPFPVTLGGASVAVTGAFFQATQPVSGTVTANIGTIAGIATEVTLAAMSGKLPATLGQKAMGVSLAVAIASDQSALAVTGTFWQATQPVSGPLTDAQLRAVAVPVSGTFFQATQPVSIAGNQAVNVAQLAGVAISLNTGVRDAGTQRVTIATNDLVPVSGPLTDTQLRATAVPVSAPTLTKGTQGANGFMVQRVHDSGRNSRAFMLDAYVAAPLAEALQSVVQWFNNAAVAGTTQPAVVTAGKTLRLTSWAISTKSLATVGSAVLRIRANTAGLVVIGSPLVWSAEVGSKSGATTVAMTGGLDQQTGVFPEGFEFPAGTGLGFTLAGYGPAGAAALQGVTRFQVYGYEY